MREYDSRIPIGRTHPGDYNFATVLTVDPDDARDEQRLLSDPNVWAKCCASLGVMVQANFYEDEANKANQDPDKRKEFFTKYLNMFQSDRVVEWFKPEDIRQLQVQMTLADLDPEDGWIVFGGFDLSSGGQLGDLYAASWLAVNMNIGKFFADIDAWITEDSLQNSPNAALYRRWSEEGWLHVVPGSVMDMTLFLNRVSQIYEVYGLPIMGFGYDPYCSRMPVNNLSAYIFDKGIDPKQCIFPISQTFASMTSPTQELTLLIKAALSAQQRKTMIEQGEMDGLPAEQPLTIAFSCSPMWPWEFGNCMLAEDPRMGNVKPIKSTQHAKVDNVQALINALSVFDLQNGRAQG